MLRLETQLLRPAVFLYGECHHVDLDIMKEGECSETKSWLIGVRQGKKYPCI